uniref:Uncharacterized protein n=1 Tax=Corethron hystrix TaxID=216773 RepID=A0A7S1B4L2_9STRA|mmetsp:Transcript_12806/g.28244  ORF Transcript_12806/g.28244 Transcript_12806/m.28244 type:complete len:260 (+) Transcript_12806:319-1098(+)
MWKPGTDRPSGSSPTGARRSPPSNAPQKSGAKKSSSARDSKKKESDGTDASGISNPDGTVAVKELSGSIMGLRFMMRGGGNGGRVRSKSLSPVRSKPPSDGGRRRKSVGGGNLPTADETEGSRREKSEESADMDVDEGDDQICDESDGPLCETYGGFRCPVASNVDMYGPTASLVGRRSFNNFNPIIQSTYGRALEEIGLPSDAAVSASSKKRAKGQKKDRKYANQLRELPDGAPVGNIAKKSKKMTSISQIGNNSRKT